MTNHEHELIERERLHLLQQFVLNRESEEIREELYEYMIMSVIFRHSSEDGKIEKYKIHKLVETDFHLSEMPGMQVKDGIFRLLNKNSIHEEKDSLYLSKKNVSKFKTTAVNILELETEVLEELKTKISAKIHPDFQNKVDLILKNFDTFMSTIFKKFGIQAAQIFAENKTNLNELQGFTSFTDLYRQDVLNDLPDSQREQLDKVFYDFFSNPTEKNSKYFFSISQSYVLTQILNVEPNLKKIQSDLLSKKTVYLDTNVLIRLLFDDGPNSKAIKKLIDETKNLKINLMISELTSSELKTWLEKKENKYKQYKLPSTKLAEALGKFDEDDDPFFSNFTNALATDSNLTSKKFCKKFYQFEVLLANQYGIDVEQTVKTLKNSVEIKKLQTKVLSAATRSKSDNVAFHDAYSIMRIRQLRESKHSDELGPNTWFVTTDFTLFHAEQKYYQTDDIQSSITVDAWFQMISTFISPIGSIENTSIAFCKLLSSHFDSHKIRINDYLNFVDALTDDADFTLDQLTKITGNTFVTEKLRNINKKREAGETPTKNEIQIAVAEMQKFSKGSFDEEIAKIREESNQKIKDEALRAEHAEKKASDAEKKALDAEKKALDAEKKVSDAEKKASDADKTSKSIKIKSILIILALGIVVIHIILDLTVFKDIFLESKSAVILVLTFNIGTTIAIPKLVHFFYKAD